MNDVGLRVQGGLGRILSTMLKGILSPDPTSFSLTDYSKHASPCPSSSLSSKDCRFKTSHPRLPIPGLDRRCSRSPRSRVIAAHPRSGRVRRRAAGDPGQGEHQMGAILEGARGSQQGLTCRKGVTERSRRLVFLARERSAEAEACFLCIIASGREVRQGYWRDTEVQRLLQACTWARFPFFGET